MRGDILFALAHLVPQPDPGQTARFATPSESVNTTDRDNVVHLRTCGVRVPRADVGVPAVAEEASH